jgi:spore coat protein SA
MIYHLLDEPFSAHAGLGVATVVANIMRFDESSVVVCPGGDDSRGIGMDRVMVIPQLKIVTRRIGWQYLPVSIRRSIICRMFAPLISKLRGGDIVWCHNWPYVAWALEETIHSKGAKLVYHSHNTIAPFWGRPVFRSFAPDAMVFNSEAMRQDALAVMPYLRNTYTVHNGADDALFHPRPPGTVLNHAAPVILYVGRLVHAKGVHVLMEAMRILNQREVEAVCRVVGSSHAGGDKGKATPYVDSLHNDCPPNVQFEGFRSGMGIAEEYRSADILCCPSIWQEPFGNVNIEAMACALPVVASRVGGIPEIASEGGILLVDPESPIELADALQKLILDKGLRAKIGAEGLASFRRRFTWPAIVRQHREIAASL